MGRKALSPLRADCRAAQKPGVAGLWKGGERSFLKGRPMNSRCLAQAPYQARGAVLVFTVVTLIVLLGFAALTVDVGYLYNTRADLQDTADAAVLASVRMLPNTDDVRATAREIVSLNLPNDPNVLNESDLRLGNWDAENGLFIE